MLQHLVLLIEKITPIEIAAFLQNTLETIESITIQCHFFKVDPDERGQDLSDPIPPLDFHVLKKYITTCRTGDKLFGMFASAPKLEELHLNGEPRLDEFPVRCLDSILAERMQTRWLDFALSDISVRARSCSAFLDQDRNRGIQS